MKRRGPASRLGLGVAAIGAAMAFGATLQPAQAQFVCQDVATGDGQGAVASGTNSTACGNNANASGVSATATGNNAQASGENSTATGQGAEAIGNDSTATGAGSIATGIGATATGVFSTASGLNSTASGTNSTASGANSTALGANSEASFANSAAIGAGAKTTRANQMSFGSADNTYTMSGVTSDASRAAQSGPLEVMTTDAYGKLASDGGAFQRQIDALGQRDDELAEGIAIALALDQPIFHAGQSFAFRLGYGNFDGSSALGLTAAGILDRGWMGDKSTITLDGGLGVGTQDGTVAGKAGLSFGW